MPVTYSHTFVVGATTASFLVLTSGRGRGQTSSVSRRHIPAGDTDYLDLGGQETPMLHVTLLCENAAARAALEGLVGQQGTLTTDEDAGVTAVLEKVSGGRWWPSDQQEVSADFYLAGAAAASADTSPAANFVVGVDDAALTVAIDINQGSSTVDNIVDSAGIEWGDGDTATLTGPYDLSALEIPVQTHTYSAAGAYQINVSITRSSVTSADASQIVTVGAP